MKHIDFNSKGFISFMLAFTSATILFILTGVVSTIGVSLVAINAVLFTYWSINYINTSTNKLNARVIILIVTIGLLMVMIWRWW